LNRLQQRTGKAKLTATEYMDDGSPITLTVDINEDEVLTKTF